ncbi:hypothetical protein Poli38472_000598 [Pythium oligandrum]|uniref:Nop domain-containing protein n=1 Tax=Pythium oligandrum TaxID=41045 RepID=A0A8K1FFH3_PYTOL|nr:hypothetical protein Poli38472_000598 [Pythium oligandrum]|eukprot:TMW60556.1 hypothetical protein Poli38472_000598 [Pythium oligandrum]
MASVADSFLDDLDELSGDSGEEEELVIDEEAAAAQSQSQSKKRRRADGDDEMDEDDGGEDEDGFNGELDGLEDAQSGGVKDLDKILEAAAKGMGIEAVAHLKRSKKYQDHVQTIQAYANKTAPIHADQLTEGTDEYNLVVTSNDLMVQIDDEIAAIHRFIAELYAKKFPELDSLVPNALDYARVVQAIGNETDMTLVDLSKLLPSAAVISISVTGSATSGKALSPADLKTCMDACAELLSLNDDKHMILQFVESRMDVLAPNVTHLVGTRIAAQLVGLAGGVAHLSRIPSCNLQVLGQQRKVLSGFSSAAALKHTGIIFYSDLVQNVPPYLRMKACRALAGKIALMARVDSQPHKSVADTQVGLRFRDELIKKFDKLQEPQKAKTKKALPIPDEKPRRKRGGKRYRKMKERMQMTDVRRELNRQTFASANDEYGDNAMGLSSGRLGQEGSGTLRIAKKEQRQSSKKLRQASVAAAKSAPLSGLASSLAFTPVQGIELVNPEAAKKRVEEANKKYFAANSGFVSVIKKP